MSCSFDFQCTSNFEECCNGYCSSFCPIVDTAINISTGVIVAIVVGGLIMIGGCITACVCCCKSSHRGAQRPHIVTTSTTTTTVPQQQRIPLSGPSSGYHGHQAYPPPQPMQNYPQQSYPLPQQQGYPPQPAMQAAPFQAIHPGQPSYSQQLPSQGIEFSQPATNPNFKPPLDASTYPGAVPNNDPPPYTQ